MGRIIYSFQKWPEARITSGSISGRQGMSAFAKGVSRVMLYAFPLHTVSLIDNVLVLGKNYTASVVITAPQPPKTPNLPCADRNPFRAEELLRARKPFFRARMRGKSNESHGKYLILERNYLILKRNFLKSFQIFPKNHPKYLIFSPDFWCASHPRTQRTPAHTQRTAHQNTHRIRPSRTKKRTRARTKLDQPTHKFRPKRAQKRTKIPEKRTNPANLSANNAPNTHQTAKKRTKTQQSSRENLRLALKT